MTQVRPERRTLLRGSRKRVARQDNRLAFIDQAAFLSLRATGRQQLMQCVWIYERPVDFDGLRRFHENFGYGLVGRRIARSPLPFGRHRWVSSQGPASDIEIADRARPRAELTDWADECVQLPMDPESGPGWRLSVLPLTDGATAVSLAGSHCLVDGVGAFFEIMDAANGTRRDFGYPPPREGGRFRAALTDARDTVRDLPEVGRTLAAAAKLLRARRDDVAGPMRSPTTVATAGIDGDRIVVVPAIAISIDVDEWDARADALGGTNYSLLAGYAVRLAVHMGRSSAEDGAATLLIALSDRTPDDTRANAMTVTNVRVDPTDVTTDLSATRAAIRQSLKTMREVPDEAFQLLPLTPFIPRRAVKRMADVLFSFADLPVSCSNLGDLPAEIGRPDGTDADFMMLRPVDQHVTVADLERERGQLVVVAGRIGGKVSIGVVGYQCGAENSKPRLRELAARALAEFNLTGVIE